ncbi:MAG: hypothetical protein V1919_02085 [Candidatus Omnitrophota bacterium]
MEETLKNMRFPPYSKNTPEKANYKAPKIPHNNIEEKNDGTLRENEPNILEKKFDFSAGRRRDKFNWNIAGDINGENPNILSELSWNDLRIFQIKTDAKFIFDKKLRMEGSYGYGWIYHGDNQDSDFSGDDRTFEFSRSNNKAEGDNVLDWSAGLGYQFNLDNADYPSGSKVMLVFLAGYSCHEQNLIMTDGFQSIPAFGPFEGLNCTYQAEWKGPWLGAEVENTRGKIVSFLRFEYHWADYFAEADWNLRDEFAHPVSFSHDAEGKGTIVAIGIGYNIKNKWLIYLKADIQDWNTYKGIDRVYFSDGSTIDSRLNRVNWKSSAVMIGVRYLL